MILGKRYSLIFSVYCWGSMYDSMIEMEYILRLEGCWWRYHETRRQWRARYWWKYYLTTAEPSENLLPFFVFGTMEDSHDREIFFYKALSVTLLLRSVLTSAFLRIRLKHNTCISILKFLCRMTMDVNELTYNIYIDVNLDCLQS